MEMKRYTVRACSNLYINVLLCECIDGPILLCFDAISELSSKNIFIVNMTVISLLTK